MKKGILVLLAILMVSMVFAKVTTYAQMRYGWWYEMQDEDFTGIESRMVMHDNLYTNSRFGSIYEVENFTVKFELGVSSSLYLRHFLGTYNFGSYTLSAGKTFTGFSDFADQAASINLACDDLMIGYGMAYDGPQNQICFNASNLYVKLMQGVKMDPWGDIDGIDNLFPKVNFGYKYKEGNLYLHPTFGFNMSKYNDDFSIYDDTVIAFVGALSGKLSMDRSYVKFQVNYGQNMNAYGIKGDQIPGIMNDGTDIVNISTFGGYVNYNFAPTKACSFTLGGGYVSSDSDLMDDPDTAMSVFVQCKQNVGEGFFLIPEIGMIDDMENGFGGVEGSRIYFGTKFQYNFKHTID